MTFNFNTFYGGNDHCLNLMAEISILSFYILITIHEFSRSTWKKKMTERKREVCCHPKIQQENGVEYIITSKFLKSYFNVRHFIISTFFPWFLSIKSLPQVEEKHLKQSAFFQTCKIWIIISYFPISHDSIQVPWFRGICAPSPSDSVLCSNKKNVPFKTEATFRKGICSFIEWLTSQCLKERSLG